MFTELRGFFPLIHYKMKPGEGEAAEKKSWIENLCYKIYFTIFSSRNEGMLFVLIASTLK